jgi:FMN phosphatase YigB (HAD superfamily)
VKITNEIASFKQLIKNTTLLPLTAKIISLDFFDTIARRKIPELVLLERVFTDIQVRYSLSLTFDDFMVLREQAYSDSKAKQNAAHNPDQEINVSQWYQELFNMLSITDSKQIGEQFVELLCQRECENLILNPHVFDFLQYLKTNKIKTILVSDTYYPIFAFAAFLDILNLKNVFSTLYLSCEIGLNKSSGKMFAKILEIENESASSVIHIGDNVNSDYYQAKKLGVKSIRYISQFASDSVYPKAEQEMALYDFGKNVLGPVIVDFCYWLKAQNTTNIFFLARDGYLLSKIFQKLFPQINSNYLYFNRVLANQLEYKELNDTTLRYVQKSHKADGLYALVKAFGLYKTHFQQLLDTFCFKHNFSRDALIDETLVQKVLRDTVLTSAFKDSLHQRSENSQQYLAENLKTRSNNLVDIGWRGSILNCARRHFDTITECYLLCSVVPPLEHVKAYVNTNTSHGNYLSLLSEYRDFIEWCLSENVGATLYVDDNLNVVRASVDKISTQKELVQQGILNTEVNKDSAKGLPVLDVLKSYLGEIPQQFYQAMCQLGTEIGIDGQSQVSFKDLLMPSKEGLPQTSNTLMAKQGFISVFLDLVEELKKVEQLVIYGAGTGCDFIIPHLGDKPNWIVDINGSLHGKKIKNIEIKGLNSLTEFRGCLVVTVIGRRQQITAVLQTINCKVLFLEDYLL